MAMEARTLRLQTPAGTLAVPVELERRAACGEHPYARVRFCLQGNALCGEGWNMEKALIALAKALPEGYALRCCLSCRHGNFCPCGDGDDELFCLSDIRPQGKADVFFPTSDDTEREKRRRSLFFLCPDYAPQEEGYFTYSSFLYEMRRR